MTRRLKRIGRKAQKLYPWLNWSIQLPSPEIEKNYGKGFILQARNPETGKMTEYFILWEDPRIDNWIYMIAIELDPQVTEE